MCTNEVIVYFNINNAKFTFLYIYLKGLKFITCMSNINSVSGSYEAHVFLIHSICIYTISAPARGRVGE